MTLRLLAGVVALMVVAAACGAAGSDTVSPPSTSVDRPPLDDPPDPGPVPSHDGLTEAARDAIVASTARITGVACGTMREGSGFAIDRDLVVTNAHVILGIETPMVELADGQELSSVAVAFDAVSDLAVLRVAGAGLAPLELGTALDGTVGTLVGWEATATPEPTPFRIDRPVTVRINIVGGTDRVERKSWLVAADIESGDSGAPLVDGDGVVVGVAYATTRRDLGVAYATRAEELERLIDESMLTEPVEVPDCR